MNRERILQLADYIEGSESYKQSSWFNSCGTPGCIAGHAVVMKEKYEGFDKLYPNNPPKKHFAKTAQKFLDLSDKQSLYLFDGYPFNFGYRPTGRDAAKTLRYLAETGEVFWFTEDEYED